MTRAALAERVRSLVEERVRGPAAAWVSAAALAFGEQLAENGAPSHRELVDPIAAWLGFSASHTGAMGDTLDLLQVAFDYADNLVDEEEDARRGRTYHLHYQCIPRAAAPCLPALLCSVALERLVSAFGGECSDALRRVVSVLGDMAGGQGTPELDAHVEMISGRQALLLCLPLWLAPQHPELTSDLRAEIERWAVLWGNTWQLQQQHAESGTAATHFALKEAVARAIDHWPRVGPFRPGHSLSQAACFPSAVC